MKENLNSDLRHAILDLNGSIILLLLFVLLFVLEDIFGLRRRVQPKIKRIIVNTIVSIPAFAALRLIFIPTVVWIAYQAQSLNFGIANLYSLPEWVEFTIAFILLDYGNYRWHILLHRLPFLWRFHLVHHTDLDLDVSTAARFHFVELFASVIFRGTIIFVTGASPLMVLIYEILYEGATQFHHSNLRLPTKLENVISKIVVTPRMHGIHHSIIKNETDSNFSIIFSLWDRVHKTLKLSINQNEIVIGVPSYQNRDELTSGFLLKLPFTKIRPWGDSFIKRNGNK